MGGRILKVGKDGGRFGVVLIPGVSPALLVGIEWMSLTDTETEYIGLSHVQFLMTV